MRLVASALAALFLTGNAVPARAEHAPDRLLVKLRAGIAVDALPAFGTPRAGVGIASLDALLGSLGAREVEGLLPAAPAHGRALAEGLGVDRWCVVRFLEGVDVAAAQAALAASADVEIAELDHRGEGAAVTPNDPDFTIQWHLKNNTNPGADIHATDGWTWTTGSASVVVGILDSGGDWDHPDLSSRIWSNPGEVAFNGVDDDANGYVDDVRGWDFVNNDNNPMDDHGHGTHVAGIVGAATHNGVGVAGVDWNCRLLLAKNLDAANSGFYSWWTSSIYYAANEGAKVLNMSEGGLSFSASMLDAVNYAHGLGALVVVAMMNANSATPYYPANYANTVAVGATNDLDRRAVPFCWGGGSSYGPHIELVAPGNLIYSTLWDNTYGYFCGTSQATPQVSGAAALLWALRPTLSNADVRSFLLANADDQVGLPAEDTPGFDQYHGYGRLNLDRALAASVVGVEPGAEPRALEVAIGPNPAGEAASIQFRLPAAGVLAVDIYDPAGRRCAHESLADTPAGPGTLRLDTTGLAAGVYLVRITHRAAAGGRTAGTMRRIAVVR